MGSRGRFILVGLALAAIAPGAAAAAPRKLRLLHDTFSTAYRNPSGAVRTGSTVTLRLRVTGEKPKGVTLVVSGSASRRLKMRRHGALWSAALRTPATPGILSYSFRVQPVRGRVVWYGDDDSSTDIHKGGTGRASSFEPDGFKLTVYAASFTTPSWLQGAVVYEIFPDRFRDGDPSNDYCRAGSTTGCPTFYGSIQATGHATWNEPLEDSRATGVFNRDFFGGDLQGVTQELDYLKALGVDAIWLTPIFKARSNHRYDTDDYLQVDSALGGNAAFASLTSVAHLVGVRLILDGVFNHTSSDSRYFDRYNRYPELGACESPSSTYRSWFSITGSDVPCTNYSSFAGLDSLPQLNHANAQVREFIYKGTDSVVRHWDDRGADGWRLDAAQEIDHGWWRDFRTTVKAYAADSPLVGEITAGPADATPYLLGNELDGVMNYRFRNDADGFVRTTNFTDSTGVIRVLRPSQLDHALHAELEDYPLQAAEVSFNLIDSHDTNRALFVVTEPGDSVAAAKDRQKLAALLQFTSVGAPMVYYGDEAGINAPGKNGFGDPYNRAPYPWSDQSGNPSVYGPADQSMLSYYSRLASLRRNLPALRGGSFETLLTGDTTRASGDNNVYAFLRAGASAKPVVVVVNKGSAPEDASIPLRGAYPNGTVLTDGLAGKTFTVAGAAVKVSVPARGGLVLSG
jgi:glycosidase